VGQGGNDDYLSKYTHFYARVWYGALRSRWMSRAASIFDADGKVLDGFARSPEHLLEICDVIARLLAARVVESVCPDNVWGSGDNVLINAPALAHLMEQCQSLKALTLTDLEMDEHQIRVLGAYSRL
jgi:hypothetical protein